MGLHKKKTKSSKIALGYISITPLIVLYLIGMDVLYLVNTLILLPLILIIKILSFGKIDILHLKDKIDDIYKYLFDMSYQDISGFRRLRTISQLTFETLL